MPQAIKAAINRKKKMVPELNGRCKPLTKARSNLPARLTTCGMTPQRIKPKSTTEPQRDRNTPHSAFDFSVPFLAHSTNKGTVISAQMASIQMGGQKKAKKKEMMANESTAPMPVASLESL